MALRADPPIGRAGRGWTRPDLRFQPTLSFALLVLFLGTLLVAGGASRSDAAGQVVVRTTAWTFLIVAILFAERPPLRRGGAVAILLALAVAIALVQLIPLPPALWQSLPGRGALAEAATASGQAQPWRPIAIVPSAAVNALSSLIVPVATLLLSIGLTTREHDRLPGLALLLVVVSTLLGVAQLSGIFIGDPMVNVTPGQISGLFANRNHFALFVAFGFLLAPIWASSRSRHPSRWRGEVALMLMPLFALAIIGTGSRAGLVVGAIGLAIGLIFARGFAKSQIVRDRRRQFGLAGGIMATIALMIVASITFNRAVSIDRMFTADVGSDMRGRALPTVIAMIRTYFPVGSGIGGFDPIFRMHEPLELLRVSYFNHAHNDLIEVVLDAGLAGLLLLAAALGWFGWASMRAWSRSADRSNPLARLGSAILLLIVIASIVDYPARTPLVMAMIVLAGVWLSDPARRDDRA